MRLLASRRFGTPTKPCRLSQSLYPKVRSGYCLTPVLRLKQNVSTEDGDVSDDDEIEVGGVTQDYKCPITLTILVDPLTSYVAVVCLTMTSLTPARDLQQDLWALFLWQSHP